MRHETTFEQWWLSLPLDLRVMYGSQSIGPAKAAWETQAKRIDELTVLKQQESVGVVRHENGRVFCCLSKTRHTDDGVLPDGTKVYSTPMPGDVVKALEAERDELLAALEPFAAMLPDHYEDASDDKRIFSICDKGFTVGDLRRAVAAIANVKETR